MRCSQTLLTTLCKVNDFINPLVGRANRPPQHCFSHTQQVALWSNSHSIYANLTAEEALMRGVILRPEERLLFMYCNDPCVVVGRNQSIFTEVALRRSALDDVKVARRSSGGGAVYQDAGNLCFSFFTHRSNYAPDKTIQILRFGLAAIYGVAPDRLTTTKRYDLYLDGLKITGSAMRVQRDIAFHHCTLLVDTPLENLSRYLHGEGDYMSFRSSSVGSVRSPVTTIAAKGFLAPVPLTSRDAVEPSEPGTPVGQAAAFMADFFVRYGRFIADHKAPWELSLSDVLASTSETPRFATKSTTADLIAPTLLDIAGIDEGPTPFLVADQRPISTTDCSTFQDEVRRISGVDWLFAMPPFTTTVLVTPSELSLHLSSPLSARGSRWLFPRLSLGENSVLLIEVTVEHRRISEVLAGRAGERACMRARKSDDDGEGEGAATDLSTAPGYAPLPWLTSFLSALLVGSNCNAPLATLFPAGCDGRDALLQGLQMELQRHDGAMSSAEEAFPEESRLDAILEVVRAVVGVWRDKNVFDYEGSSEQ